MFVVFIFMPGINGFIRECSIYGPRRLTCCSSYTIIKDIRVWDANQLDAVLVFFCHHAWH